MRILHTSDWHLGRSFHREGLLDHQGAFIDHLIGVVETENVDLVVVSGDVYDRALPPWMQYAWPTRHLPGLPPRELKSSSAAAITTVRSGWASVRD